MTKADEDSIREIELQFNEAWGRHSADDMVASLSDDAQFVTVNGAWTKTRADYLELMTRLHGPNGPFRKSTREPPLMHMRLLAPHVAMMHSEFHIYGIDEPTRTGIGTASCTRSMGDGGPLLCKILTCGQPKALSNQPAIECRLLALS